MSHNRKAGGCKNGRCCGQLPISDFEDESTTGGNKASRVGGNSPIPDQPVDAAVESLRWIEQPDFRRKRPNLSAAHVRGIGNDKIESASERRTIVACNKARSISQPERNCIFASAAECA